MTLLCLALLANFMLATGHDQQRLVEISAVLLGGGLALAERRTTAADLFAGRAGTALAAFFGLGILGAAFAFSPRYAFFEVANLFLLYLLMPIIGGVGSIIGPVLGALIVSTLQIKLLSIPALRDSFLFIYGGLLILVMLYEPLGLVGIGKRIWAFWAGTLRSRGGVADAR